MSPTPLLTALIVGSVAVGQESSPSTEERYRPIIQQIEQALPAWLTEAPDCLRWPDCMTESKDTQKAVELLKDSLATDERLIRAGRRVAPLHQTRGCATSGPGPEAISGSPQAKR